MSKLKSHSGSKKRFKCLKSGNVKRYKAYRSHLKTKKSPQRKRRLRQPALINASNLRAVKQLLAEK